MRKLFKGGNYSRAETIWGNTVCWLFTVYLGTPNFQLFHNINKKVLKITSKNQTSLHYIWQIYNGCIFLQIFAEDFFFIQNHSLVVISFLFLFVTLILTYLGKCQFSFVSRLPSTFEVHYNFLSYCDHLYVLFGHPQFTIHASSNL